MKLWIKRLVMVGLLMAGAMTVYQFTAVWLEYHLMYPPEQQFAQVTNGEQIAVFSVKYEGAYPWWPVNPKPHFYITLTEAESGELILRETDFDWPKTRSNGSTSFINLTRAYAPWAEYQFQPKGPNPTSLRP